MTASYWSRKFIKSQEADVIIVGAGFAGLSTAFWLTQLRPELRITIIDRLTPGAGASGRNAGFLTKGSSAFYQSFSKKWGAELAVELFKFAENSIQETHDYLLRGDSGLSFELSQSLTLLNKEEPLEELANCFQWVSQRSLPDNLKKQYIGGYKSGPEYKINPRDLLTHLEQILRKRRVHFENELSAYQLVHEGLLTEDCIIKGKKVVLALNGYFPQFHSVFKKLVTPRRAQMVAVQLSGAINCPDLYYHPDERVYWRMHKDNILLIGGKRLVDAEGEIGDFEKVSPAIQDALEDFLKNRLGLKYQVLHRWSGVMGFTDEELPFVSRINAPLDAFAIGGFSGHGMGLGFRSGKQMAQLITGELKESFFSEIKSVKIDL